MSDQIIIHSIRQSKGSIRQPPHSDDLRELHDFLVDLGEPHPYELPYDSRVALETKESYAQGGRGLSASILPSGFLYRISSAKSVAYAVDDLRLGSVTKEDPDSVIWNSFNDISDPDIWRRLNRYAEGELIGRRGITWWTSLALGKTNIVAGAYKMGMYDLWVPVYTLLLRCPVSYILAHGNLLVPTVLDAFDQEVFYPTQYSDTPTCGISVSLENSGALAEGTAEFILGPVPVNEIEVLPVFIDGAMRMRHSPVEKGPESWALLEEFLNRL